MRAVKLCVCRRDWVARIAVVDGRRHSPWHTASCHDCNYYRIMISHADPRVSGLKPAPLIICAVPGFKLFKTSNLNSRVSQNRSGRLATFSLLCVRTYLCTGCNTSSFDFERDRSRTAVGHKCLDDSHVDGKRKKTIRCFSTASRRFRYASVKAWWAPVQHGVRS